MRRLFVCAAVIGSVTSISQPADAAWSTGGGGGGAGGAYTMPAGSAPVGTVRSTTVGITWTAAHLPGGPAVAGYIIRRYDAGGNAAAVGGTCAGVVASTSCTEVVGPGTWTYTDTPVQLSWTGEASPPSAAVTVA